MARRSESQEDAARARADHDAIVEPARETPVRDATDVLVAGGGPAGVCAALAAARTGASVRLIDTAGCLGGIWTAGLLSWILDVRNKPGLPQELTERMAARWGAWHGDDFLTRPEVVKAVLETLCEEVGVHVRLHTRVVATRVEDNRITHVVTESKSGREAWQARAFVDTSGDGDLGALAGCRWDYAHPEHGRAQPFSLIALVGGPKLDDIADCVRLESEARGLGKAKENLLAAMHAAGLDPSYASPFMAHLGHRLYLIMWNHAYDVCAFDADDVTAATRRTRAELHRLVDGLRDADPRWRDLHLVATADQIGTREGRRIVGRYQVTADDVRRGAHWDDGVCTVRFGFDVHATDPTRGKGYDAAGGGAQPYQIPARALMAADRSNLFLAGRCLSGDFLAHSSYRVTGNATATGEAAGRLAATAARESRA